MALHQRCHAASVDGVLANTVDDSRTWAATVLLPPGTNALVIEAQDSLGNVNPTAATLFVRQEVILQFPLGMALDPVSNRWK